VVSVRAEGQLSDFEYEQAVISVWNTGNGFSPNQLSELFNRFQSFDYSGREKRGNGIGLYLTKTWSNCIKGK
jgi:signal transduction histidine kinase